jgi:phosphatidylserine/phosphatidylglycerophosphate/cardiolipin synthase-like enzyme
VRKPLYHNIIILFALAYSFVGYARETPTLQTTEATRQTALPELQYRTWTSISGDTIEAAFINLQLGQVVLSSQTATKIVIPIERLTWSDQILARRLHGQSVLAFDKNTDPLDQQSEAMVTTAFGADCQTLLLQALSQAKHEILIAIYTFTSTDIQTSLLEAADQDVQIHIKYDAEQIDTGRMEEVLSLLKQHKNITIMPVNMSGRYASMHHKFAIIDRAAVFTGSFNFTVTAATRSYENAAFIRSLHVAEAYRNEFDAIDGKDP